MAITVQTALRTVGVPVLLAREWAGSGVSYNFFSRQTRENPYPVYDALRRHEPMHWSELARVWFVTRYADVASVLRDPRFSVEGVLERTNKRMGVTWSQDSALVRASSRWMVMLDPPDHTRLRNLVNRAFTPRAIAGWRSTIQAVADSLLDEALARGDGRLDIVADYANPLPVLVFARIVGMPPEDHRQLKAWVQKIGLSIDPIVSPAALKQIDEGITESAAYFERLIEQRRREPRDDLLSSLIAAEEHGDVLSQEELLATCVLLLVAGIETTSNLIGTSVLSLLRHPDQRARLQADPSLIETAVEEFLRFESPIQLTGRVAKEDLEFGGRRLKQGDVLGLIMGAANRDPEQFPDPHALDVGRAPNRQSAFGFGPHFCVGSPLARAEGQIAVNTLLQRLPRLRPAGRPAWRTTINHRGLQTLPVDAVPSSEFNVQSPASAR